MNWLTIVVLALIVVLVIRGYQKGIIKMVLSLGAIVLSIVGTLILGPIISGGLCNSEVIMKSTSQWVNDGLGIEEKCLEVTESVTTGLQNKKINNSEKKEMIEELSLPAKIKNTMIDNVTEIVGTTGTVTAKKFAQSISEYLAKIIIKAITYIVIFIILKIIFRILVKVFNILDNLPVIGDMNELAGAAVGGISGIFIVWIGFLVLLAFSGTNFGMECYQCINESPILTFLYNNNLLVHWLLTSAIKG
ncbi:MAG: CvpA family protein [Lachnospiraceae bacterium]|nr:CvpA family protein [Lachnospiraceae bacterium]